MTAADADCLTHDTPPALTARGVRVRLGGHEILHGVDLDSHPGEAVAIMGGNGSGKSTLVRSLVGAIPTTAGDITVFGEPRTRLTSRRIGYVPQRASAGGGVSATAREVVTSGLLGVNALRTPRDAKARALAALDDLGVADLADRDVTALSGGQQQRVLIARALVREPDLLILDEPMAGVDVPSQEALAAALTKRRDAGAAIIVVLHELGALAPLVHHAVVLEQGCVTHIGAPPRALGVHALPGHDHDHAHPDVPEAVASTFAWEVRQ
ncbi:metal ABC transporter ATP-binding protein [Demequina sp. NBRC 110055]|uniref:metal ABC transporter ATP-binding protein n=1 Tax=Demequina sp. NBRC 110055 TaxID=1570344 RepID=UPI000A078E69|nr:ATP-binding cassette domain-containing protein [Demequina sp. NBRC 110055]